MAYLMCMKVLGKVLLIKTCTANGIIFILSICGRYMQFCRIKSVGKLRTYTLR